jgi:hypothetical protein
VLAISINYQTPFDANKFTKEIHNFNTYKNKTNQFQKKQLIHHTYYIHQELTFIYLSTGGFMDRYANKDGDSGVVAYEIAVDSIKFQFSDGKTNTYNAIRPGAQTVNEMKKLAIEGRGFNSYINRIVRKNYYQHT